jgi:hypothetical protein
VEEAIIPVSVNFEVEVTLIGWCLLCELLEHLDGGCLVSVACSMQELGAWVSSSHASATLLVTSLRPPALLVLSPTLLMYVDDGFVGHFQAQILGT